MHLYANKQRRGVDLLIGAIVFLLVVALFSFVVANADDRSANEEAELLERAVRSAAATCYAVEGRYPPTLDYLCKTYGVIVDEAHFRVRYEAVAKNVMPRISVDLIGGDA